jgi:ubiquinone/menaquinone biosynthesis C-methylase UbiE
MMIPGSYNVSSVHRNIDREIQRLYNQVLLSWDKEARTLARFGLNDGMSLLELGSGPGFFTQKLLTWLPNITLTSVEIDPILVLQAKHHLQDEIGKRLQIIEASVMDTGLRESSFDFAVARLLFQHLPNPSGAAKEILRLLKPGGKLVIIDIDQDIQFIVDPPVSKFPSLLLDNDSHLQTSLGGNARIGRHLWRILKEVGFKNLDLEAIIFHSDELGIEGFLERFDPDLLLPIVKAELVTEEEKQDFITSYQQFLRLADPFILNVWLMACGEKP